jgi:hypothetical protein
MNESRLMNQLKAVFGIFMTLFYIGFGLYFAITPNLNFLDKNVRVMLNICGFSFILYGIYRAYRSYQQIVEVFFSRKNDEE